MVIATIAEVAKDMGAPIASYVDVSPPLEVKLEGNSFNEAPLA